jgi:small subunit ribosomal protein S20
MPIKKSAMKALRQTKKRTAQNLRVKENIAYLRKMVRLASESKDVKAASGHVLNTVKAIDKAIQNKVLKANTGSRLKSRLMKGLNKLKA